MPGSEIKANARRLMLENAPKLFIVSLLFVAIITVITELRYRLPGTENAYLRYMEDVSGGAPHSIEALLSYIEPLGAVLAVILWFLTVIIQVGLRSYCLKTTRGIKGEYKDILDGFLYISKVMSIVIISAVLIAAWTLLLIFPGVMAFYRYRQAYYILLDDPDKGALQCIRESKLMMRGHKADLFILDISFVGWFALSLLITLTMLLTLPFSVPIVSIWLAPYMGLSHAAFYDQMLDGIAV